MTENDVVEFYLAAKKLGLRVWIDGGWGVDALLGEQTRKHLDLDIAIEQRDASVLVSHLTKKSYREVDRESEWNYVMTDDAGRRIDFHIFIFDENDNVIGGQMFPTASLTGRGRIGQTDVACIEASHSVKFHAGYKLTEKDYKDVSALCERFNLAFPKEYGRFRGVK